MRDMKINRTDVQPQRLILERGNESRAAVSDLSGRSFGDMLQDSERRVWEEEIARMMEDIRAQGETLSNRLNLEELLKYKKLVARFLDQAVKGMLSLKKHHSFDRRGRHNLYTVVNTVNQKLEELTQDVLSNESQRLAVISRIDEIKGLLMDLCA